MIIDSKEAARRLGISTVRITQLLRSNRITGGQKIGGQRGVWVIEVPDDQPPAILPPTKKPPVM